MIHITIALPDSVAQEYYTAAEKLAQYLGPNIPPPNPQTLMRVMLSKYGADEIAGRFDLALRNLFGQPIPEEQDVWVFDAEFDNAP